MSAEKPSTKNRSTNNPYPLNELECYESNPYPNNGMNNEYRKKKARGSIPNNIFWGKPVYKNGELIDFQQNTREKKQGGSKTYKRKKKIL